MSSSTALASFFASDALPGLKLHQFELQRVAARIEDQRKRHTFVRCGHRLPWPGVSAQFHT
jgi:hypothetical protein